MIDRERYAADRACARSYEQRLETVYAKFNAWRAACAEIRVTASAGGGDVTVTVDASGRMTGIEVVDGSMVRYTQMSLSDTINRALAAARSAAAEDAAEIHGTIGSGDVDVLAAFDRGLAQSAMLNEPGEAG